MDNIVGEKLQIRPRHYNNLFHFCFVHNFYFWFIFGNYFAEIIGLFIRFDSLWVCDGQTGGQTAREQNYYSIPTLHAMRCAVK